MLWELLTSTPVAALRSIQGKHLEHRLDICHLRTSSVSAHSSFLTTDPNKVVPSKHLLEHLYPDLIVL
jgi:hypothetical protein